MTLMLHCGANATTREDVFSVPTPPHTATHYPVSHEKLVRSVVGQLVDDGGYTIAKESHALARDGSRYFGVFDLSRPDDGDFGVSIGVRNSHDKSFLAGIVMGTRVFVCDNLAMNGEVKVGRKHTRFIERDLDSLVCRALGKLSHHRQRASEQIAAYKATDIDDARAHDLVVRAVDARAITGMHIVPVLREWRNPAHEEFQPRNMWSLFNAFTEVAKSWSPESMSKRTQVLHGMFDAAVAV